MSMWSMARRTTPLAAVAALGLVLVAGCGGSSSDNAATTPTPTETATATSPSPTETAAGPADPAAAKAEITKNWETFFDSTTPPATAAGLLQNGDQLQQALQAAAQGQEGQTRGAKVSDVTFTSPTEATVTYDLLVNGSPALPGASGKAVLVDGTWKVSQTTFCTLAALAAAGKPVPGC